MERELLMKRCNGAMNYCMWKLIVFDFLTQILSKTKMVFKEKSFLFMAYYQWALQAPWPNYRKTWKN